ncbi:MAG: 16S rRNA (uracil(1498)-N(3))-methyltransferase [Phycisphaerales bacterium]|nr:16S rRNA (uracil(1498)-N(3))-methyltransferase [Phycisphaerales bacterium]
MKRHRFFAEILASPCVLASQEAHHATQTLRLAEGDAVELFDGQGRSVVGVLQSAGKRQWQVVFDAGAVALAPRPRMELTLAIAVPKGERADTLVEMASQLDVACIQWMDCRRSVVKPDAHGGKMEKWRRLAIESAKQCGRDYVMQVLAPIAMAGVLRAALEEQHSLLVLEPTGADSLWDWLGDWVGGGAEERAVASRKLTALVGPEGGFADDELAMLSGEAQRRRIDFVRICPNILRIETAGIAVAAAVCAATASNHK